MLDLDGGNSFGNCKYYYASYKLLNEEVYDLRVDSNFLKQVTVLESLSAFVSQEAL